MKTHPSVSRTCDFGKLGGQAQKDVLPFDVFLFYETAFMKIPSQHSDSQILLSENVLGP